MNMSGPGVIVDFSTEPSPPDKGNNSVGVKLAGGGGEPITAAQVNVTFSMPAMPAMGMAAVNKAATLADKGDGTYEGSVDLSSGGSYQVTITAQRNGQLISSKQLTVNVAGGR
jgi:Cu(I)/Ag(I) efflux system membrane fusion protein/cobalt-zinc-cadmium efflux system membrane fusion protein